MYSSNLILRNVYSVDGRTSMRLEPEFWDALVEMCRRENIAVGEFIKRLPPSAKGGRTNALRTHIVMYFRAAATDRGHFDAGHGGPNTSAGEMT